MAQKPQEKCSIIIVYNIHNKSAQWKFLSEALQTLKQTGYTYLASEASHRDNFQEIRNLASMLKSMPREITQEQLRILHQPYGDQTTLKNGINKISSTTSKFFIPMLEKISETLSVNVRTDQHILIGTTKISLTQPAKEIKQKILLLSKDQQALAIKTLKEVTIKIIDDQTAQTHSLIGFRTEAAMQGFKLFGIDVDSECKHRDISCRDEFMATKLASQCKPDKKIITTVGLGHFEIGNLLRNMNTILEAREFYPTDYGSSDDPTHNQITQHPPTNIELIDTRICSGQNIFNCTDILASHQAEL